MMKSIVDKIKFLPPANEQWYLLVTLYVKSKESIEVKSDLYDNLYDVVDNLADYKKLEDFYRYKLFRASDLKDLTDDINLYSYNSAYLG